MRDMKEDDIAIIGYAFEFPDGMDTNEKFWEVLKNGKDLVREIPRERWDWKKIYDPDPNAEGKSYSYHGAFLKDIEQFDANAFRIMPVEAKGIDPQQRLVLKTAWRAMENSYLNIEKLKHSDTGVFIGATMDDYLQLQTRVDSGKHINRYTHFGSVLNDISGRVSYVYGFHGPSMTVDTACSSSLTAVDSAIKALKEGDCEIALAGGVNVILTEELYIKFSRTQMLSKTGSCKTFDDSADGYVRGEGCGILVLQKLKDAQESGKRILAVIRGSSINHNGNSGGLTVPSGKAQIMLLQNCMKKAGVRPEEVDYIEVHGTGTQLGDKIEVNALQEVFQSRRSPVLVGSVKTNIGHLESAAGIAGIIKVLLCMEYNEFVPSIHLKQKNRKINWENSPVEVVRKNFSWDSTIKLVGVSSFGASGTNGHVIIQKYENTEANVCEEQVRKLYLAVSAKSKVSLKKLLVSISDFIQEKNEKEIYELFKLYNLVRSDYENRVVIRGASKQEFCIDLKNKIDSISKEEVEKEMQDTCILCNFRDSLETFKQLEIDNTTYHLFVEMLKEKVSSETNEKERILMGIAFCKFVSQIGLKKYKIAGDNQIKFQVMLASKDSAEYDKIIEQYLNKDATLMEELEKYKSETYIYSECDETAGQSLQEVLLEKAASQYEAGAKIQWECFYSINKITIPYLPGYEFDEWYYWVDYQRHTIDDLNKTEVLGEYLSFLNEDKSDNKYAYTFKLRTTSNLVQQHRIYQQQVLVGMFQVMFIQEIAKYLWGDWIAIHELFFVQKIEPEADHLLKVVIAKDSQQKEGSILEQNENGEWITKTIFTISSNGSVVHVTDSDDTQLDGEFIEEQRFYNLVSRSGLSLGNDYKIMKAIIRSNQNAIALLERTDLYPAILDGASQLLYLHREQENDLYMPYYFSAFEQWESLEKINRIEEKVLAKRADELIAELTYYADNRLVARCSNYHLRRIEKKDVYSLEHIIGKNAMLPDGTTLYQYTIRVTGTSLNDHVVYNRLTIPGAYFISQIMQFAENKFEQEAFEISNINFYNAMVLEENMLIKEIVQIKTIREGYDVKICSAQSGQEKFLDNAKMVVNRKVDLEIPFFDGENREGMTNKQHLSGEEIVEIQWKIGLHLSDTFHWIKEAWVSDKGIFAELTNEAFEILQDNYGTPPGLIDTSVQILGLLKNVNQEEVGAYIPMTINRIVQYQKLKKHLYCSVFNVKDNSSILTGDIIYYNPEDNRKVLEFQGMTLIKADRRKFGSIKANEGLIAEEEWTDYHFIEANEGMTYKNALEVRLGIFHRKIIVTTYLIEGTEWHIKDKMISNWEDESDWELPILEHINTQEPLLVIFSDSSEDASLLQMNVEEVNSVSKFLTDYYLNVLKLLQKVDLSKKALCFATNQVYSEKAHTMNIFGSIVWGLVRSIQLELEDEKILLFDSDSHSRHMLKTIEKCAKNNITQSISYNGAMKVPDIVKPMINEAMFSTYTFTPEKTYVVIGGFGALGLETCKCMVTAGAKKVIVIGRSSLEQKKREYDLLLQISDDLCVTYHQIDMAENWAEEKLTAILSKENSIGGIIYAAGVVKDKIFTNYTEEDIQAVYKSKINGMVALANALESVDFDFCVCFSSIISIMGAVGQSVYGAANSFIDSLCSFKRKQGKNIFTIQWGPWAEIGMFSKIDKIGVKRYENRNIYAMHAKEALNAFLISLNKGTNQMIVNQKENKKEVAFEKAEIGLNDDNNNQSVKEKIKEIIAKAIGLENANQIDDNQNLMDLGIDSLLMIEIRMKINKCFNANFSLEEFFDKMTIEKLREKVEK